MKGILFPFAFLTLLFVSTLHAGNGPELLFRTNRAVSVYDYSVEKVKNRVAVVNGGEKNPVRQIWIFHGYQPSGDPYKQSPFQFIKKWDLEKTAVKNRWIVFLPDMGETLYTRTAKKAGGISDMDWLQNAYRDFDSAFFSQGGRSIPVFLIGVSSGVEGAVKLSALMEPPVPVIALSGTYDLFSIPADSGEYRIHRKAFGVKASVWTNENPISVFSDGRRYTVYLFCEERSLFYDQAVLLGSAGLRNVDIRNHLDLGKDRGHNWDFWGDPKVVKTVMEIIGK